MAGTTGNLGWAESGANVPDEPLEALKADGMAVNHIPTSANWNWLQREYGRAAVQRYDTAAQLIQRRISGTTPAEAPGAGIVLPTDGPLYCVEWGAVGNAGMAEIAADGEYLWVSSTSAGLTLQKYNRDNGALVSSGPLESDGVTPYDLDYTPIATAGGHIYALSDAVGFITLSAFNRSDMSVAYSVATGVATAGTPSDVAAIATDGEYIAVAIRNAVIIFRDSGAALTQSGVMYTTASVVTDVKMDGIRVLVGETGAAGTGLISAVSYTGASISSWTMSAFVPDRIAYDGERWVAFENNAAVVTNGEMSGTASILSSWVSVATKVSDVIFDDSSGRGRVFFASQETTVAGYGNIIITDGEADSTGQPFFRRAIAWTGTGVPSRLAYDYEALFALGTPDVNGARLKRYRTHTEPLLLATTDANDRYRPLPSLIRPVR